MASDSVVDDSLSRARAIATSIVKDLLESGTEDAKRWSVRCPDPSSIASGSAGYAVIVQYALEALPGQSTWELVVHGFLTEAVEAVSHGVPSIALFHGLAGLAFAAAAASHRGTRYQGLLATLDERLASETVRLATTVGSSHGLPTAQFDVVSGLSGAIAYLLSSRRPTCRIALSSALEALTALAGTVNEVPRMHTPASLIVNPSMATTYQAGYVNCGLAHGLPGPLAALSIAMIEGTEVPGQRDAIRWYAEMLSSYQISTPSSGLWPSAVSLSPNGARPSPARFAWCYGPPGVLRALYLAGLALGDRSYCQFASSTLLEAMHNLRFPLQDESAALCHGIAGLLAIASRFKMDEQNAGWRAVAANLLSRLLEVFEPSSKFGYARVLPDGTREYHPGLLDGAGGIALALLSSAAASPPWWDRLLLVG